VGTGGKGPQSLSFGKVAFLYIYIYIKGIYIYKGFIYIYIKRVLVVLGEMRVLFTSHRHNRSGPLTIWFAVTRFPVFGFRSNSSTLVVRDNLGQPGVAQALCQPRAASERLASIALTRFPGPFVPGPVGQTRREREERQRDIFMIGRVPSPPIWLRSGRPAVGYQLGAVLESIQHKVVPGRDRGFVPL
jgi:hypothetical protein